MRPIQVFEINCHKCNKIAFKLTPSSLGETFKCPVCNEDLTQRITNTAEAVKKYNALISFFETTEVRVFE
ncbi:hypothetical protein MAMMFC1_01690 [Methylomusa anaerophila]|uniref:Uncharacterized protein n=1 Tax=Methylomusa anaerophila TaxID=1930071 RepID=A0A348AIX4_9FIRM|nr:hypothetical protein MAMMFC1_01690 [Methylomusa anaerophila]